MVSSVPPVLFRHRRAIAGALLTLAAACALTACDKVPKPQPPTPSTEAPEAAAAPVAVRYTPPSAEVLYQMVAPIALYPDKLVAQILAGATYPDQVTAAETWLGQNPGLKAAALADAADQQPWDPSVKSLTAFPNVLAQMASNLPWTTALGKAYYNAPGDVMNAIQVMRGRASKAGSLKNLPQMHVATAPAPAVVAEQGPVVVPPPETYITIEPTAVDTVYVPAYDPQVVYGTPVPLYPQYAWVAPAIVQPVGPSALTVGALVFGAGIVVAAAASHHHWGWDAWGMNWAPPPPPRPAVVVQGMPPPPLPLLRPSVTYRGNTYVSHSTTVVENIHNTTINNYATRPAPALPAPAVGGVPPQLREPGRMGLAAMQAPGQPPAHMPPPMQQQPPQPDRHIQALQAPAMQERQAQEQQMRRQMQMQQAQHQAPQPPVQAGPQHALQLQAQQHQQQMQERQAQEEQARRQAQMQQAQQRQAQQQSAQEAQQRAMQQQAQQVQQRQQQMHERQAQEEQARRQMQMEQQAQQRQAQQRQMQEAQQHAMQQQAQQAQQRQQQMQERQAQEEQARRQMQMQQAQLHAMQQQQAQQQRQQQMQEQQRQAQVQAQAQAQQRHEQERRARPEERQREQR